MVTRDFDAMLAEKANARPTFRVGGQEFTLRAKLPYKRWNLLMARMRDDNVDPQEGTADFFRAVLVKGDRERFSQLLDNEGDDDEDDVIDLSQLDELTDWVMEHFTGKAPKNSGSSSPGANATGVQPKAISLSSHNGAG